MGACWEGCLFREGLRTTDFTDGRGWAGRGWTQMGACWEGCLFGEGLRTTDFTDGHGWAGRGCLLRGVRGDGVKG
jgi:hypothetical protein